MTAQEPTRVHLQDYQPPAFAVVSLALDVDLAERGTKVTATMRLRRAGGVAPPLVLDGEDLRLAGLVLDGRRLGPSDYALSPGKLEIPGVPPAFTLVVTTLIDPADNTQLSGLYMSNGSFCTQCEAEGFRRITYFLDRPDVMTVFTTTIRGDKARVPVLLSNGNLVARRDLGDGRHETEWHDPYPKPCYLFALVAGDLACVADSFVTRSGRQVALRIYVEHGNEHRCDFAMQALKRAMRWDEERFGLEYDLDLFNIVAVSDFNMGAMENKSLNVFNAKYILADSDIATDTDYAMIEGVVAHEYFHNWTGNRVTCRDWFQLSLKEGLTVFRDQEFSADVRSRPVERVKEVRALRARQFAEDAGPLAHPVRPASYIAIDNFYTATVYEKGAEVIRMMQTLLGRDGFRRGMDLYFQRHDGQAVTCDDFVAAMQDANGVDLGQFRLWYSEAGTPEVSASWHYDEAAGTLDLTLAQSRRPIAGAQTNQPPLHLPLALGLIDEEGRPLPVRLDGEPADAAAAAATRVLHLKEREQRFRLIGLPRRPVPSLNRDFSAPIILKAPLAAEQLRLLMAADPDAFNRWEAGQEYATRLLLDMVAALGRGAAPAIDRGLIGALGAILHDRGLDPAFKAQAATLPSEDYIAQRCDPIDVEAIHAARESLRRATAEELREDLLAAWAANHGDAAYSPDPESAGRRALKNVALSYLARLPDQGDRVATAYRDADNMTDRIAALGLLVDLAGPARAAALADFRARYRDNALVLDKWFALQAMSVLPDALSEVRRLMDDPAFSLRNPNKVRALIGSFANGNPLRFHAADGSGYAFLTDRIIELDRLNPQIAARLVTPFERWRRFGAPRQNLMRAALERILATHGLSRDSYEMASRSLAD